MNLPAAPPTPSPSTDPPASDPDIDAYRLFKKGQLKFLSGKHEEAEDLVEQAVIAEPNESEYLALLAWIQAHILGPPSDLEDEGTTDHYDKQIRMLDDACALDETYAKALFYRAELLKQSGFHERAIADYQRVTELDPHNEEAAREVMIHHSRQQ